MRYLMMKAVIVTPSDVYTSTSAKDAINKILESYDLLHFRPPQANEFYITAPNGAAVFKAIAETSCIEPRFIVTPKENEPVPDRLGSAWE